MARAALESIAYQVADLLDAMRADSSASLLELRVDGGASQNALLLQFQADILGIPVVRPEVAETTALGAAYLAGLAVGFWKDVGSIAGQWRVAARFEPQMAAARAEALRARWRAGPRPRQGLGTRRLAANGRFADAARDRAQLPSSWPWPTRLFLRPG